MIRSGSFRIELYETVTGFGDEKLVAGFSRSYSGRVSPKFDLTTNNCNSGNCTTGCNGNIGCNTYAGCGKKQ